MNIYEEIKLLNIEKNCVRHACNRECDKCELAQDTDELLEMYDAVVKNLEKLKKYEDLEEQGRLVKLPCKVGDKVYKVDRISNKITQHKVIHFEVEWVDFDNYHYCFLHHFGKTVFLSKEEAEAKLKGFGGGENADT